MKTMLRTRTRNESIFSEDFINKSETWEQNIIHTFLCKLKGFLGQY